MKQSTTETILIIIACLLFCMVGDAQKLKPKIDTVESKVIFTDENGKQYKVNRSEKKNRSFILKDGKQLFLFKREKPCVLPVKYLL